MRAGAPSENARLQERRHWLRDHAGRVTVLVIVQAVALWLAVVAYSSHELAPYALHRAEYATVVGGVRQVALRTRLDAWTSPTSGASGEIRRHLDRLGVRVVAWDGAAGAILLRPGGAFEETALAYLPHGPDAARRPAFAAGGASPETWEPVGDGWYRVRGRW